MGADGAEAGARNIEHRGIVGLGALRPADGDAEIVVLDRRRHDRMRNPAIADGIDVADGAEGLLVVDALGAAIDEGALFARERQRIAIVLDDILPDFRADGFDPETEMADQGVVAQDRMLSLDEIRHPDQAERRQYE